MKDSLPASHVSLARLNLLPLLIATLGTCALTGCKDGPMYALKTVNPYYSLNQWRDDEALGVTDHERRKQLAELAEQIGGMSANRQAFWAGHLTKIMENDTSPEMRRLAVVAAGKLKTDSAIPLVKKGLDDDSLKVRLYACEALGRRPGDESARMLAETAGTETNVDVRQAALSALAKHKSPIAVDALRIALSDRDPATRDLAMVSLRSVTGKNYGSDPNVWIAKLGTSSVSSDESKSKMR